MAMPAPILSILKTSHGDPPSDCCWVGLIHAEVFFVKAYGENGASYNRQIVVFLTAVDFSAAVLL